MSKSSALILTTEVEVMSPFIGAPPPTLEEVTEVSWEFVVLIFLLVSFPLCTVRTNTNFLEFLMEKHHPNWNALSVFPSSELLNDDEKRVNCL